MVLEFSTQFNFISANHLIFLTLMTRWVSVWIKGFVVLSDQYYLALNSSLQMQEWLESH